MSEELRLWTVGQSGEAKPLSQLRQMPTELEFEDLLVQNPEMLGSYLKLVGRQTPTESGWLDLLAIDRDGRLVVFELKRGTLAREAVTQVVDYASALDAMSVDELSKHISDRSGSDGIQAIEDFEQWYADNTIGGDDLSRLLPPRMVLVGLGIDPVAERMARFISGGPVDLSVVTFHGFMDGEERVLARQLDVEPDQGGHQHRGRPLTAKEKRRALREYLTARGYAELFDRIYTDIRQQLPELAVYEHPGRTGIRFTLPDADDSQAYKSYFGVQAGYMNSACTVSILPHAIRCDASGLQQLKSSIKLHDWPHGGYYCEFQSEEEWSEGKAAVLQFVTSVMTSRSQAIEVGT